jgi:hypothetical protein
MTEYVGPDNFVYIMGRLSSDYHLVGPSKIGISSNPSRRLKQVQASQSDRIVLVCQFGFLTREHARSVEKEFHRNCAGFRLEGEWFDMAPSDAVGVMTKNLSDFIEQVMRPTDVSSLYTALDIISTPGFHYLNQLEDFRYEGAAQ